MGSLAEELRSCAFQVHGKGRGRMDHLEVRSGEADVSLRALFPSIALVPHSCRPNVKIATLEGFGKVVAATKINTYCQSICFARTAMRRF